MDSDGTAKYNDFSNKADYFLINVIEFYKALYKFVKRIL